MVEQTVITLQLPINNKRSKINSNQIDINLQDYIMPRVIVLIYFVILAMTGFAQSFTIYNYSVDEGLPSSEVYEVFQDSKGFLWFATDNGIAKFDGNRMERFHSKDGLTDPVVFSFFEDHKKRLWFRTFSGVLCYMEDGQIKKYKYNDVLKSFNNKAIFNFVVNENDELWFSCSYTVGVIDSTGHLNIHGSKRDGYYYQTVGKNFVMGTSNLSVPFNNLIIDEKIFPVKLSNRDYMNRVLRAVNWKGKTFISLNYEVFAYDGNKLEKFLTADYPVVSLSVDEGDNLWVGYLNGGAERFSNEDHQSSWKPEFLKNRSVTKVIEDHEGGLWFSTLERGVYHVPNLMIRHYDLPNTSRIRGVIDLDTRIVVGDQAGELIEINVNEKKIKELQKSEPLVSLFKNRNRIFLSTNSQIKVYDKDLNFLYEIPNVVANDYAADAHGNTWAFGGYRLLKFGDIGELLAIDTILLPYRALLVEDSVIFFGERTGLHVRTHDLKLIRVHEKLADIKISDIKKLNDSTLLITTIGKGFILMNPRSLQFRIFNSSNNFIADHVFSSLILNDDLWLGTEKGLIKFHLKDLENPNFSFQYLTQKGGLVSDKIDFLLAVNNDVWVFSENHFSIVPKSFMQFANATPLFYVHSIKVNDRSIDTSTPRLALLHDENNIKVDFGFISFNNQNILLRYRLTSEELWNYTNDKQLLFLSLAPGDYTFEIEYSTDNVQWRPALQQLRFNIALPWWKRWYVLTLVFIGLLALGYLYLRYQQSIFRQRNHYLSIINEHQQRLLQSEIVTLERERNRISKELHDQVGTNLSAIKLTVNQILKNHGEPMTEEIEDQFQVAIQEIKNIIYGLTPPGLERYGLMTGMKNYIGKLTKSIPLNISLKTFGEEPLNYDVNIMVFRAIQELLSNSIKHSYARNVTIHINAFEDMLNIVYEDDGIGFSYEPEKSGLGLDNIESRIHSVNGTLKFESGTFGVSYTIDIPINLNKQIA